MPVVSAHSFSIGATPAEKSEGTSRGVDCGYQSTSFFSSVLSPSPAIAPPMFHPFLFPSPLKFSWEVCFPHCPEKKMAASCKRGRGPKTFGPHYLQSWRGRVPWGGCGGLDRAVLHFTSIVVYQIKSINYDWCHCKCSFEPCWPCSSTGFTTCCI